VLPQENVSVNGRPGVAVAVTTGLWVGVVVGLSDVAAYELLAELQAAISTKKLHPKNKNRSRLTRFAYILLDPFLIEA
jgi:hypothetical protein